MLFVDMRINEGNERILSHCRKYRVIYWGNCQVEPKQLIIFCDEIRDFLCIFQIDKAEKYCCRVLEISNFSCYLFTWELMKELNILCLIPESIQ